MKIAFRWVRWRFLLGAAALFGCSAPEVLDRPGAPALSTPAKLQTTLSDTPSPSSPPEAESPPETPEPAGPRRIRLVAGGDVSFGRDLGQKLIADPQTDFFGAVLLILRSGDVRFVNVECPLSDQKGETQSPWVRLIFTGPPQGADALARAKIDVVSTANNHSWDYGKKALFETIDNLDRVGVKHVGTGRTKEEAYRSVVIERNGARIGFLAVTGMWNFGPLYKHAAAEYVADATKETLIPAVRELRAKSEVDFVVVSYHGGVEYLDLPMEKTRTLLKLAIEAGADAVIGHHPHIVQGIEWYQGKPILYSLGNMIMQMSEGRPKVSGCLARLRFEDKLPTSVEICPLRFPEYIGRPLLDHSGRAVLEKKFFSRLSKISKTFGGVDVGEVGADGCAQVTPPAPKEP